MKLEEVAKEELTTIFDSTFEGALATLKATLENLDLLLGSLDYHQHYGRQAQLQQMGQSGAVR
jgi:hypothetical protein